ncbi:MAG: acylphosphatase [Nitrososphaerota archaeon]
MKAFLLRFYGRVQRVGFRRFVQEFAQDLGLSGYVKNERDGSVTVFVQGDDEAVAKFIEVVKSPPPPASIKIVEEKEVKPRSKMKFFEIRYGKLVDELQEGFGAMQSIFMDYWSEFRDYRQEFRDYRQEFKDYRQEFKDYRQEFRDYRQEFRNFEEEFRGFAKRTDDNFKVLVEMYKDISEKLTKILDMLMEESRRTREMLEVIHRDSVETREMLNETMKILREVANRVSTY